MKRKIIGQPIKEWLALARQGDPKAQFFIGNMYYKGVFVSQNDGKAVKWYKEISGTRSNKSTE